MSKVVRYDFRGELVKSQGGSLVAYSAYAMQERLLREAEQQRDELMKSASAILTRIDNSISGNYAINFGACSDEVADLRKAIAKAGVK